jgi:TonB family protein
MKSRFNKAVLAISFLSVCSFAAIFLHAQEAAVEDKDVSIVSFEALNYPALARGSGIRGVVVLRVTLDQGGHPTDAIGISGNELLIKESIANVKKWRFRPNARKVAIVVYDFEVVLGYCEPLSQFILRGNHVMITTCEVNVTGVAKNLALPKSPGRSS